MKTIASDMQGAFEKCQRALWALLFFCFPFEHKYDKLFRFFSKTLRPEGLELAPSFDQKIYFYGSDLIAIFSLLLTLFALRSWRSFFSLEKTLLFIVFLFGALSILASPYANYPLIYTRLLQWFTPFALFTSLSLVQEKGKMVHTLFRAFFFSSLIQCAIALCQYGMQSSLGLRLFNEPPRLTGSFSIPLGVGRWIFDQGSSLTELYRVNGTLPHCNVLGGFLLFSLLVTYALYLQSQKKIGYAIALFIQVTTLSLTFSRSALFGWLIATSVWLFYCFIKKIQIPRSFFFVLAGAIALNVIFFSQQYLHRGGIYNYNETAQGSDEIRTKAQRIAFQMIKDHPWLGVGYQQHDRGAQLYLPERTPPQGTHNIYLLLAAETGLISLLAFVLFLFFVLFRAWKAPPSFLIASMFSLLIGYLFIGMCDFYLILFQQGKILLFGSIALFSREKKGFCLNSKNEPERKLENV